MSEPRNIVLTGPSGSGKTTVGRLLASSLGRPFLDMDSEIEKRLGASIPELFSSGREKTFREAESELLVEISTRTGLVVASGGGALVPAGNRDALRGSILVNLMADTDELLARLGSTTDRPLLDGDRRRNLLELLEARRPLYAGVAIQVDTTGLEPGEVARTIAARVEQEPS